MKSRNSGMLVVLAAGLLALFSACDKLGPDDHDANPGPEPAVMQDAIATVVVSAERADSVVPEVVVVAERPTDLMPEVVVRPGGAPVAASASYSVNVN